MSPFDVTALRSALALNPLQLAERLGVSANLVLQWEAGDRFPTKKYCEMMHQLRIRAKQSRLGAAGLERTDSAKASVAEVVQRLLEDPKFARRLRDLVTDYLNSSLESEAPTSLQPSSVPPDTEASNSPS